MTASAKLKLPRIVHNLICGECGSLLHPILGEHGVLYDHAKDSLTSGQYPKSCPLEGHLFGLRDNLTVYKVR